MITVLLLYILFAELTYLALRHYILKKRLQNEYTPTLCLLLSGVFTSIELVVILFLAAIKTI